MNKGVKFEQLDFDFNIQKEKEYTKETGIELEKPKKEVKRKKKKTKIKEEPTEPRTEESYVKEEPTEPRTEESYVKEEPTEPRKLINTQIGNRQIKIASPTFNIENSFVKAIEDANEKKFKQLREELDSKNLDFPYIKRELMTSAEKQLYYFMRENLYLKERIVIFSKVRLGDIMDVDTRIVESNSKAFYKIACKHVDYLIVDKDTLEIICAVELDDYTHESEKAKERDMFVYHALSTVGIELVRIKTLIKDISKQDLRYIEHIIATKYSPKCPICGGKMLVRESRQEFNKGHRFYGCAKNYDCCGNIDID